MEDHIVIEDGINPHELFESGLKTRSFFEDIRTGNFKEKKVKNIGSTFRVKEIIYNIDDASRLSEFVGTLKVFLDNFFLFFMGFLPGIFENLTSQALHFCISFSSFSKTKETSRYMQRIL